MIRPKLGQLILIINCACEDLLTDLLIVKPIEREASLDKIGDFIKIRSFGTNLIVNVCDVRCAESETK